MLTTAERQQGCVWLLVLVRLSEQVSPPLVNLQCLTAEFQKLPPIGISTYAIEALKQKVTQAISEIRAKTSELTTQDLGRLLFRCVSVLISMPEVSLSVYRCMMNIR